MTKMPKFCMKLTCGWGCLWAHDVMSLNLHLWTNHVLMCNLLSDEEN